MSFNPIKSYFYDPNILSDSSYLSFSPIDSPTFNKNQGMTFYSPINIPFSSIDSSDNLDQDDEDTMYLYQDSFEDISTEDKSKNYKLKKILGSGTFGQTFLAYDIKRNIYVAYKMINIDNLRQKISAFKEANALQILTSPKCNELISCYYDSFETKYNGQDVFIIISEYIEGLTLYDFMYSVNKINKNRLLYIIYQLIQGLKYIHENGYAHRDIKPQNIMITNDDKIKYIDFGLACKNITSIKSDCLDNPGTILYIPPKYHKIPKNLNTAKSHDIWSLGITIFQLANGPDNYPFETYDLNGDFLSKDHLIENINNAPTILPNYQDDDINIFIESILINDINLRPDIYSVEETFYRLFNI